jgi:hypothetical protein
MAEDVGTMELVDDPAVIARERQRVLNEQADRNYQWLRAHWEEILPQARGKAVAVAGQEAFIADTDEEARASAQAAHPEDEGLIYTGVSRCRTLADNLTVIHLVDDPLVNARARAQDERFKLNLDWLQTHWGDLLPQARGKYVVVAGQEPFVADQCEDAWVKARAAHPEDDGAFCHYITTKQGPRIYAHRG